MVKTRALLGGAGGGGPCAARRDERRQRGVDAPRPPVVDGRYARPAAEVAALRVGAADVELALLDLLTTRKSVALLLKAEAVLAEARMGRGVAGLVECNASGDVGVRRLHGAVVE